MIRPFFILLACLALGTPGMADNEGDALPRDLSQQVLLNRYATPESNFAYLNQTLLHYRDDGEGPALLLIHGSLQDLLDWDPWVAELSQYYRVIRFDMPAAGLTGKVGSGDYSIANTMRTVDALMNKLGEERFAVVGTSLGGIVAFRYAATRRERVAALILMNSAGVEWGNEKIIPPQPQRYNESLANTISRSNLETIMAAVIPDPENIPPGRIERGLDYQRREGRHLESAALVQAYDRGEPAKVLEKIVAPTLLLWGADNRALDPRVADEFARLMPCSSSIEKALVPNAGHWPHVEAPMRSVRYAEEFLGAHYLSADSSGGGENLPDECQRGDGDE